MPIRRSDSPGAAMRFTAPAHLMRAAPIPSTWQRAAANNGAATLLHEVMRDALRAPVGPTGRGWTCRVSGEALWIEASPALPGGAAVADDPRRYITLGSAAEKLAHAAQARGLTAEARLHPVNGAVLVMTLSPDPARSWPFVEPQAGDDATATAGVPLGETDLQRLQAAGCGHGVRLVLLTAREALDKALGLVSSGALAGLNPALFAAELAEPASLGVHDGWMMSLFFRPGFEGLATGTMDGVAAGIALFLPERGDRAHWIATGRCGERFARLAAQMGVRNAFLDQLVLTGLLPPTRASRERAGAGAGGGFAGVPVPHI